MFDIPDGTTVFIDHVQTRMEKHGDENVPAVDVSLTWRAPALTLETLDPGLTDTLFTATPPALAEGGSAEGNLPFESDPAHAFVRFPALKTPLGVVFDSVGYTLTLRKIGQRRAVTLSNCKIGKLRLTPQDGGYCEIMLLVQSAEGVDADVAGTLDVWQQASAWCALVAPQEGDDPADIDDEAAGTYDDDELPALP